MTNAPAQQIRRAAALVALVAGLAALAVLVWLLLDHFQLLALALAGQVLLLFGLIRGSLLRWPRSAGYLALAVGGLGLILAALTQTNESVWLGLGAILLLQAVFAGAARAALRPKREAASQPSKGRFQARRAVLILNPKSGGGKAEKFQLAEKARALGVEAIVLGPDDDLEQLARDAVARGTDVLGMGGGDGSQALVASVCVEHDLPFVCIPAGTRNHFAMDLGLDRSDPSLALAAFAGEERRIDYALVNGRLFVNNCSLGLYARIVHEPGYREAKAETAMNLLPDMLGEDAKPFDLRFKGPDGAKHEFAQMLLVSNNPYVLMPGDGFGYRTRLDGGELGIVLMAVEQAPSIQDVAALVLADPTAETEGFQQWCTLCFEIDSKDAKVLAGIDGEALQLEPPLQFESRPGGLRVLVPPGTPHQVAPPQVALDSDVFKRLWDVAHGRAPDGDVAPT
jgi:diacylglycerol kinase family enzyme